MVCCCVAMGNVVTSTTAVVYDRTTWEYTSVDEKSPSRDQREPWVDAGWVEEPPLNLMQTSRSSEMVVAQLD